MPSEPKESGHSTARIWDAQEMGYTKENPTALVGSNTFREWTVYIKCHCIQE